MDAATVVAYGQTGLLVTFTQPDRDARWAAAQALQTGLLDARDVGVVDVVAGFETVFVTFDPATTDHDGVRALVADRAGTPLPRRPAQRFTVPVVYGGVRGPDLDAVAAELGLDPAELVRRHTSQPWTVRFRGSPVAAPLMDGPPWPGSVPRRASPRTRVPPGSVALSGAQCIVYPVASPGGWRLIGQTPLRLVDLTDPGLVPYRPGDTFRFVTVTEDAWDRWTGSLRDLAQDLRRELG